MWIEIESVGLIKSVSVVLYLLVLNVIVWIF